MIRTAFTITSILTKTGRSTATSCCGVVAVLIIATVSSGCATTRAASVVTGPPLTVPEPPPRVLVPPEEEPLAAIGNGTDTPLSKSPQVQPTPLPVGGRRSVQTRGETEPRASEPASAAATSVLGPNTPAETPLELKPLPTGTEPNLDAKGVNATLTRVNTMLQSVDSRKYSSGTYKDAKQFVKIASERLKERNYTAAAEAADKALKLATDLVGR